MNWKLRESFNCLVAGPLMFMSTHEFQGLIFGAEDIPAYSTYIQDHVSTGLGVYTLAVATKYASAAFASTMADTIEKIKENTTSVFACTALTIAGMGVEVVQSSLNKSGQLDLDDMACIALAMIMFHAINVTKQRTNKSTMPINITCAF